MKINYQAWEIKEEDFPQEANLDEQVKFLLGYAILAPSAHNSQPWAFKVSEKGAFFYLDRKRTLRAGDRSGSQNYIGLGACLENFIIAARHFGFDCRINYESQISEGNAEKLVYVEVNKALSKPSFAEEKIFNSIKTRVSAKQIYLNDNNIADLKSELENTDMGEFVEMKFISDRSVVEKISDLIVEGTLDVFKDQDFRKELGSWLRNNETKLFDGMPGFTVGMPTLLSFLAPIIMPIINLGAVQSQMAKKLILNSSFLLAFATDNKTPQGWIDAGRSIQRIWLKLTAAGWGTSPLGALTESDTAATKLANLVGLKNMPVAFFRAGKPRKQPFHSPRRTLKECLV